MLVAVILLGWLGAATRAEAGGRKRVVVLEFDGPKAEKFQEEIVKLLKKTHTVVSTDKWNTAAEGLDATKVTDKNVKKVAKKLKIDGVIQGKIEKRRDEYIVKLKLRNKDGDVIASPDSKWDGPKLDGKALRDVKDELVTVVDSLEANRGGGGDDDDEADKPAKKVKKGEDDEEDKPAKKVVKKEDDEDEDKPKKGFGKKKLLDEDEDKPKKAKKGEDDEDKPAKKVVKKQRDEEDDSPLPKAKKSEDDEDEDAKPAKKKKVASDEDDDGGSVEDGPEDDDDSGSKKSKLSPGERAVDLAIGMSVMSRKLGFTYKAGLAAPPPGYRGAPVGGVLVDATLYPLAIGHKRDGMAKNLGLTVMLDKVIKVSSQYRKADGTVGTLASSAMRYAIGGVFRYPFNKTPTSPVIGAGIRVGGQSFEIGAPAERMEADIPNVNYLMVDPGVFLKYPATEKITLNVNLAYMAVLDTGEIQSKASYGAAKVTGFEGEVSGDYMVTKNILVRAAFRFETIGFQFSGNGDKSDKDGGGSDVAGARDTYIGGAATIGYVY